MEVRVGLRVVRGPDWSWGDQDGGEGHVGTVVEVEETSAEQGDLKRERGGERGGKEQRSANALVTVQWDCGPKAQYCCGVEEKFDLRLLDNAPAGVKHPGVICDVCDEHDIKGFRWKCVVCYDYDLCSTCYVSGQHKVDHPFQRYEEDHRLVARMPPRGVMDKVEAKGLFPGAEVVRGPDWAWEEQDGGSGKVGRIHSTHNWKQNTWRSGVEVEWIESSLKNKYRIGFEGKVDLKCVVAGKGEYYYPEHLPVLGAAPPPADPRLFCSGDVVRVELELDIFQIMQQGHGGWSPMMAALRGKLGVVHSISDNGDMKIKYGDNLCTMNPEALVKVIIDGFKPGTMVRVMDDLVEMRKLQHGWGEWNEDMSECMGQVGVVTAVVDMGVIVEMKGRTWVMNPDCLSLAPGETMIVNKILKSASTDEDQLIRLKMMAMMSQDNTEALICAALLGDVSVITDYLRKYPNEVSALSSRKAAIHCAALRNKIPAINLLLEFGASVETQDSDGDSPLHFCAIGNSTEAAKLLLDCGADPNARNKKGLTPIHCAVQRCHSDVLKVLLAHPKIEIAAQDEDGDTPLHLACLVRRGEAVRPCVQCLLNAGADPTLVNFKLNSTLHLAALANSLAAAEEIVRHVPASLKLLNHEDATALHLVALSDNVEMVNLFVQQEACNIDALTHNGLSALHVAAMKKKPKVLELLVGYGAQLDLTDDDGDTPLHMVLDRELCLPSDSVPRIHRVQELLHTMTDGASCDANAIVACFLVQEGAKIDLRNSSGKTPLNVCSPQTSTLVSMFSSKYRGSGSFYGSLKSGGFAELQPTDPQISEHMSGGTTVLHNDGTYTITSHATTDAAKDIATVSSVPQECEHEEATRLEEGGEIPPLEGREADIGGCSPVQVAFSEEPDSTDEPQPSNAEETTAHDNASSSAEVTEVTGEGGEVTGGGGKVTDGSGEVTGGGGEVTDGGGEGSSRGDASGGGEDATIREENPCVTADLECFLCDSPVTIQFQPCGHSPLCELCGRKAKRCPECKMVVERVLQLSHTKTT